MSKKKRKIRKFSKKAFLHQTGKSISQPGQAKLLTFKPEEAEGQIFTSFKTLHGEKTKFLTQLEKNDFIQVEHPVSQESEERKVIAILSDKSALLDKAFSGDLQVPIQFKIRKQDREQTEEETLEEKYQNQYKSVSKKIKKQDNDKQVLEYRQKSGMWSYKTIKEEVDSSKMTKEKLLNMRSKKSRDKFCWI